MQAGGSTAAGHGVPFQGLALFVQYAQFPVRAPHQIKLGRDCDPFDHRDGDSRTSAAQLPVAAVQMPGSRGHQCQCKPQRHKARASQNRIERDQNCNRARQYNRRCQHIRQPAPEPEACRRKVPHEAE